jgi:hypothetical protein
VTDQPRDEKEKVRPMSYWREQGHRRAEPRYAGVEAALEQICDALNRMVETGEFTVQEVMVRIAVHTEAAVKEAVSHYPLCWGDYDRVLARAEAAEAAVKDEKERHARTQGWLERFQGALSTANIENVSLTVWTQWRPTS